MKKTLFAALAAASVLAAPLVASAQDHHGGRGGAHAGARHDGGGHFRGGSDHRNFDRRGSDHRNFDHRRDFGRHDFGRRDFDRHDFGRRDFRRDFGHRSFDRHRSFRWGVGAFLPRSYWSYSVDPFRYGLGIAPYGSHWVVVGDEALLIDNYTGAVLQAVWI
jgi:Ni/Co efflux regulator RcnB